MSAEEWVAEQLRQHAGGQFYVAANTGFPGLGQRDLVVLDAKLGVLAVLEVKQWGIAALRGTAKTERSWEVRGFDTPQPNPVHQAEEAMRGLLRRLPPSRVPRREGGKARDTYWWTYGVIFPNLSRDEASQLGLFKDARLLPVELPYLWRESFTGNPVAELRKGFDRFLKHKGWPVRILRQRFAELLWDKISPDTNAAPLEEPRLLEPVADLAALDGEFHNQLVGVARGPHRVNGVVGSGKTLFVAHKAIETAEKVVDSPKTAAFYEKTPPVLVVCQTMSGASKIRNDIEEVTRRARPRLEGVWDDYVEVRYFHDFLRTHYGYRGKPPKEGYAPFLAAQEPRRHYEAVLFDEFQDAEEGWGSFIAKHLRDPDEGLLLLTFDPAQGYRYSAFSARFDEVLDALKAAGGKGYDRNWLWRSAHLKKSHRVPESIGKLATGVHSRLTRQVFKDADKGTVEGRLARVIAEAIRPTFVSPGGKVIFRRARGETPEDEALAVHACITEDLFPVSTLTWGDVAVIVPPEQKNGHGADEDRGRLLTEAMDVLELDPLHLIESQRDQFFERGDRPVVSTPIRIKGLELPAVVVTPSLLRYLDRPYTRQDAFYQAATRATTLLAVVGDGRLFDTIEQLYGKVTRNETSPGPEPSPTRQ
jgi:hypothetical protein